MYELDKDTVDVLIFGASHAFSSFSPEDLYEDYGITAYVQSSSCQRIWQSYYYLEEALKYQKPQYVILEPFWSFDATAQSEAYNREAIDPMRMSMTKIRAIHTAVSKNPEGEYGLSYIFPLLSTSLGTYPGKYKLSSLVSTASLILIGIVFKFV